MAGAVPTDSGYEITLSLWLARAAGQRRLDWVKCLAVTTGEGAGLADLQARIGSESVADGRGHVGDGGRFSRPSAPMIRTRPRLGRHW
jgi:hypothetical protein